MKQGQDNRRLIERLYQELLIEWNLAIIEELVAPVFVGHDIPPEFPAGCQSFNEFYAFLRPHFRTCSSPSKT